MSRPHISPANVKTVFERFPGLDSILNEKDQRLYPGSVVKSWRAMAEPGGKADGLARAVSDCLAVYNPDLRSHENSLLLPLGSLSSRALDATTGSHGGYLVSSDVSREVARVLRPYSVCVAAGAQVLTGLSSNFTIGREVGEVTFQWYAQSDTVTATDEVFGALNFTPHRCAGLTGISKELTKFARVDVQAFVIDSLARGLAAAVDRGALNGSGVLGEPLGIYNANIPTVTFSGAATLAKAVDFQTQILNNKGRVENIAYVAPPNVRAKWQTIQEFTGSSFPLWHFDETIAGSDAYTTTNMPAASIIAGDFSSMFIGFFGDAVETIVDPYSSKKSATIELLCTAYADAGVPHLEVFVKNSDSALQ